MTDFNSEYRVAIENAQIAEDMKAFEDMLANDGYESEAPSDQAVSTSGPEDKGETPVEEVSPETEKDEQGFMSDVGDFLKELPMQLVGGVGDAVNNTIDAARSAGQAVGIPNYALQFTDKDGNLDFKYLSDNEVEAAGGLKPGLGFGVDKAETAAGGVVRSITQFAVGFLPVAKGLKAAGFASKLGKTGKAVATGMTAGGISDAIVADPHQERLSTLLNQVPALGEVIPDYMADNDAANESEWEGRLKNVIEGAALGAISEVAVAGAVKMFKGYKLSAAARKGVKAEAVTPESALKEMDEMAAAKSKAADEMVAPVSEEDLGRTVAVDEDAVPADVLSTTPEGKTYLNTARIDTEADVIKVMKNVADKADDTGTKTFGEITEASKSEMKNVNELLDRPTSRPFTAEEAVASRNILTASGENLADLAKVASSVDGSPADLYNFRKALAAHEDIQAKVFAGRKATAQALASWRITAKSDEVRGKAINALLEGTNGKDARQMAKAITAISEEGGNVSKAAGQMVAPGWKDVHYQVWINGLLSSPATHAANVISNMGTTVMGVPERYVTAAFEKMTGINGAAFTEANARAAGFMSGIVDGFKMMSGKMDSSMVTSSKIESKLDAISSTAWGKQPDSTVGKGIDYIGKAVGLPGWALEKGDLFFKGINYRMMLNEKATKTALEEGLTGKEFSTRVTELVSNPTEGLQDVAADFAKYQTFTDQTGEFTQAISKAVKAVPGGKYVMPFINTPSNIIKYSFERTPLAVASSAIRADLKAGGSRAAEIMARMTGGSMIMAGTAALTLDGQITGSGPSNYKERKALEASGWQPYSVKIGGKYISYQRLEPIGSLIGYAADIASITGQMEEEDSGELVAAGLSAAAKNLTNKTFLSGISEFVSVVASGQPKAWEKYSQRMLAGVVQPAFSSAVKKGNNYFDDVSRDYTPDSENGYLKSIFLRAQEAIPGMGTDAPPLRDMWGEERTYSKGIAPVISTMSPIAVSAAKEDPINDLIADNRIPISAPQRQIKGVELSNKEYSQYTKLAGEYSRKLMEEAYESGVFNGLTQGPDGEQALIVRRTLTRARKAAQVEMMLDSPDLEDRYYANQLEKEQKLTGE